MRRRIELRMWAEACEVIRRAERLQHRFFEPAAASGDGPSWEPPVDMFETDSAVHVAVALPGVDAEHVQVVLHPDRLVVSGERALNMPAGRSVLHRLEIPNGRFERHIALPRRSYHVRQRTLTDGCLTLVLEKQ